MIIPLPPFTRHTLKWALREADQVRRETALRSPGYDMLGRRRWSVRMPVRLHWDPVGPYHHAHMDPDFCPALRVIEVSADDKEVKLL